MRLPRVCRGLIYVIFLVICVEIALQGFYYVTVGDFLFRRVGLPIYSAEPYAGYRNRPSLSFDHWTTEFRAHYYINQAGFRVPQPCIEYTRQKPSNTYRIMLLGPSFAFGWGVDYGRSFAGILQQLLQGGRFAGDKKIELINAGIPAMPLAPQLVWFERVGKNYNPDLVIQIVYGSMTIRNISLPPVSVDHDGYLFSDTDVRVRWREGLKRSATVFYGWFLWTTLENTSTPVKGKAVQGAGREMYAETRFDPNDSSVRESMVVYTKLIETTRAAGARLLVVFLPLSYAIHREDAARWRHRGVVDVTREAAFNAEFVYHLNNAKISSIDITKALSKAAESGERLYFWLDIHWTPLGNAIAARAVADYLTAD